MTAAANNPYALTLLIAGTALAFTIAGLLIVGLCKSAGRQMPTPPEAPPAMPPTLATHIARQAVAELDAEWLDLQRATGDAS